MDKWHVLFGILVWSTCLVCPPAYGQDHATKANLFLASDMRSSLVHQPQASKTEQPRRPTVSPPDASRFRLDILQYLNEKRGKIPVYSGMDGKLQLEFGLFGYLGIKYRF